MRYIEPIIGILRFLWVLLAAILPKGRRSWQQSAEIVMALAGMALFGLVLYVDSRIRQAIRFREGSSGGDLHRRICHVWLEGLTKTGRTVRGQRTNV